MSPSGFGFASVGRVRGIGHERYEPGRQAVVLTPLAFQALVVTLGPITAPTSVSRLRRFEPHLYGTVSAIHWVASGETQRRDAQIARLASARPAALAMRNVDQFEDLGVTVAEPRQGTSVVPSRDELRGEPSAVAGALDGSWKVGEKKIRLMNT
jgi:hypothetical protein